ncbi:MAG: HAD hydrolase family protein [Thermoplasmatota archaeon]
MITIDLDGTLLPNDTAFATILRDNGHAEFVQESDRRYFAGELGLEECFWEQWGKVRELSLASMHRALRKANWLPGIETTVREWAKHEEVMLLTDQPSTVTDFLGRWGLRALCSPVTVLEGEQINIEARFDKWANLQSYLDQEGIDPADVVHIGNGANDVPVWEKVGGSIAVFADPEVAARAQINLGTVANLADVQPRGGK